MWPFIQSKRHRRKACSSSNRLAASTRRGGRVERLENRLCLSAVNWINPNGGNWDVAANWSTGAVPAAHDDVTINTASAATITIQSGDTESIHSLTTAANDTLSITGGSLSIGWNSTLNGPLTMTGGSLTASGVGVNVTVNGATTLNGATSGGDVYAEGGATLALPRLTSYASFASSFSPRTFQADGKGSVLDISSLSTLAIRGDWNLNAINGGEVDLTGMTSLNGSSEGNINLTDTGGSRIIDTNVTAIVGFRHVNGIDNGITLDGTDQHVADSWTKLTNSSWYVSGGSYALSHLTDIDNSNLSVFNGASLSLPGVTSYAANDTGFYAGAPKAATHRRQACSICPRLRA